VTNERECPQLRRRWVDLKWGSWQGGAWKMFGFLSSFILLGNNEKCRAGGTKNLCGMLRDGGKGGKGEVVRGN